MSDVADVESIAVTALPLGVAAIFFWWAAVWAPYGVPVAKTILSGVAWKEAAVAKEAKR